jgi:hypothetical protein
MRFATLLFMVGSTLAAPHLVLRQSTDPSTVNVLDHIDLLAVDMEALAGVITRLVTSTACPDTTRNQLLTEGKGLVIDYFFQVRAIAIATKLEKLASMNIFPEPDVDPLAASFYLNTITEFFDRVISPDSPETVFILKDRWYVL